MGAMTQSASRRLFLLCASCCIPIVFIIITTIFLHSSSSDFGDVGNVLEPYKPGRTKSTPPPSTEGPNLGSNIGNWAFDAGRDGRNFGLTDDQCDVAFPDFYHEIERAVAYRKEKNLPNIVESQMDVAWRKGGEIIRLMIYDRQVSFRSLTDSNFLADNA